MSPVQTIIADIFVIVVLVILLLTLYYLSTSGGVHKYKQANTSAWRPREVIDALGENCNIENVDFSQSEQINTMVKQSYENQRVNLLLHIPVHNVNHRRFDEDMVQVLSVMETLLTRLIQVDIRRLSSSTPELSVLWDTQRFVNAFQKSQCVNQFVSDNFPGQSLKVVATNVNRTDSVPELTGYARTLRVFAYLEALHSGVLKRTVILR